MKKVFALILALCLALSLCVPSFAASAGETGAAEALYSLNLFKGTSTVSKVFELDRGLTRYEGYALLIRMLGVQDEAMEGYASGKYTYTFTDVATDWVKPYVAYSQSTGLTYGIGNNQFGGTGTLTDQMFMTMTLRALGYKDSANNGDFVWNDAVRFAAGLGISLTEAPSVGEAGELDIDIGFDDDPAPAVPGVFTRGNSVEVFWMALNTPLKGLSLTLAERLISQGVFTEAAFAQAAVILTNLSRPVAAHTHTKGEGVVAVAATCTHDGQKNYYCTDPNCGVLMQSTVITATGHHYGNDGVCTGCGAGCNHTYGDWTESKKPTCSVPGEETRTCGKCGHVETRPIEKTAHDYLASTGKCKNCGAECPHVFDQQTGLCTTCGHACDHAGSTYMKDNMLHWLCCPDCGHLGETQNHRFNSWDFDAAMHWKVCSVCGYAQSAEPHRYSEGVCLDCGAVDPNYVDPYETPEISLD